jgi:hypothetical protein
MRWAGAITAATMTLNQSNPKPDNSPPVAIPGEIDPVALAFSLQEQLSQLQDARLNGADVSPLEELELEEALEAALAAEPDARNEILPQLAALTAWLAGFIRGGD